MAILFRPDEPLQCIRKMGIHIKIIVCTHPIFMLMPVLKYPLQTVLLL